ncbi:hypothetical protein HZA97_07885 [Candidatus Woesearchaeota archaeon]|nr:hypothetical protein [Candidatus Woesearchaeota archaeon]
MAGCVIDNGAITYFGRGKSNVLLFLRGLGTVTEDYQDLLELLSQNYEVVVPTTSKMKKHHPQPRSIDEYIERLQELCLTHKIEPRYVFGHSLGGHLTLKEPVSAEKNIAISPIVPVDYGIQTFLARAVYQGVKGSIFCPSKGSRLAKNITWKITRNLSNIIAFVNNLNSCTYAFTPEHPSLVIEAKYDEFFPPNEKSKKLFEHKNITHKILPKNHSWPNFHPEEVYKEVRAYLK